MILVVGGAAVGGAVWGLKVSAGHDDGDVALFGDGGGAGEGELTGEHAGGGVDGLSGDQTTEAGHGQRHQYHHDADDDEQLQHGELPLFLALALGWGHRDSPLAGLLPRPGAPRHPSRP